MNTADRIQSLRKAKGISQEELADIIGVSRQAVSKWESEQSTPDVEKIILLSDYFGTTTDYLLRGIEQVKENAQKRDAMPFFLIGTMINALGLLFAIAVWIERQVSWSVGAGLSIMALGTTVFLFGQLTDSRNRTRARAYFFIYNVWFLLLIPSAVCFNILDGLLEGYAGLICPLPLPGNSFAAFGLYWLLYLAVCIAVDVLAARSVRRQE